MATRIQLPQTPIGLIRVVVIAVAALLLFAGAYSSVTESVAPGEVAVRQVFLGPSQGIREEILGPGLHLVTPGYERLHVFPRTLQILEFNSTRSSLDETTRFAPAINIQTSEGYRVEVDVAVAYRIVDPYKLITTVGPGDLYDAQLVRPRADQVLRQKLGELNAEQFYSGPLRRQKSYEARDLLDGELSKNGVQIWAVLVREYRYDARYQKAIEQRKIQDQMVFKNRAEALASIERSEKNRVEAEGRATIDVEKQRGASEVQKIRAEADLFSRKRIAEGDLLVELARAEAKRLENDALTAAGASNVVGLEMADALQNVQIIIVPTDGPSATNPLNLDSLTRGW